MELTRTGHVVVKSTSGCNLGTIMRRIFHTSTAIAACLSLLSPQMAAAQAAADGNSQVVPPAEEIVPKADAAAPTSQKASPAGGDATVAAETDADAAASPVEAEMTTPEGGAGPASEAASDVTAEPDATENDAALDEAMAAEQEEAETEASEATGTTTETMPVEGAGAAEVSSDAEASSAQTDVATPAVDALPEADAEAMPDTNTTDPEAALEDAMAAEQQSAETEATGAAPEAETTLPGADDLTDGLEPSESSTVPANPPAPLNPGTEEPSTAGADGQNDAQTDANASGTDIPTTTADAPTASETSAQTADAPTAAALDDSATAEVTEEEVTEENSRSSSEDFATTLQQATSADGNQQQSSDSDDDNDLAKAILLGLGGVAVGAMLNNNRQVALSTPDRIVVTRSDGTQQVIRDDVALLRQPGSTVATENFDDGSSRTTVTRSDGSRIVTIRDADLRILRRTLISADGEQTMLLDDTSVVEPVNVASLPAPAPTLDGSAADLDEAALREALMARLAVDRRFSLSQVRDIPEVRSLVTSVDVNAITFQTDSAAIDADQAKKLTALGNVISEAIAGNPNEIFLVEGHTDTVGDPAANLALSDRRAESVALALSEYFQVPPENMVIQGYGEQFPRIQQEGDIRENRRASVRRITDLLQTAAN